MPSVPGAVMLAITARTVARRDIGEGQDAVDGNAELRLSPGARAAERAAAAAGRGGPHGGPCIAGNAKGGSRRLQRERLRLAAGVRRGSLPGRQRSGASAARGVRY